MSEWTSDVQALLDHGRAALGPDRDEIARVRQRVAVSVGAVATTSATAHAASAKIGIASMKALAVKLAIVVSIGGAVATTVAVRHTHRVAMTAPVVDVAPAREAIEPVQPHVTIAVAESPAQPQPPVAIATSKSPRIATATHSPQQPIANATSESPAIAHASLARETELVDAATRAMHAGDYADVRQIIFTYRRETAGTGQLAKEIAAVEVEALCRAGDPAASTALAAFADSWPRASQLRRLTAACKGSR
ncbi:MAG: hypothetical protein QM831_06790 [Kofleriaceae bacterium]